MLKPLIIYPSLMVEVSSQPEQGAVLTLQCTETKAEHPDPSQVYTKVLTVLKTLHEHLFGTSKLPPPHPSIQQGVLKKV